MKDGNEYNSTYGGIDRSTEATIVLTYPHHEIHDGHSFITDAVDASMTTNNTLILAFKTPNTTKWFHLFVEYAAKSAAHVDIIEAPTWTTSTGSQNPVYNRHRNSALTTDVLEDTTGSFTDTNNVVLNPTGLSGGTIIHDLYSWADKKVIFKDRENNEFILKQNTQYAIRLTADATGCAGHIILNWYEHTDANA